jgi:hypothetical protein
VILSLYGRLLLTRSSRNDNPYIHENIGARAADTRAAWSEGWGEFFAAAVLTGNGTPDGRIYRDSRRGGVDEVDLETNGSEQDRRALGRPSRSAGCFGTCLTGSRTPGTPLRSALAGSLVSGPLLKAKICIDLADFLETLQEGGVATSDQVEALLAEHIPFPRVLNRGPFPPPLPGGGPVECSLGSFPNNPVFSLFGRDYYLVELAQAATVKIELSMTASTLDAPLARTNLDLALFAASDGTTETPLAVSALINRAPNGKETIQMPLAAGRVGGAGGQLSDPGQLHPAQRRGLFPFGEHPIGAMAMAPLAPEGVARGPAYRGTTAPAHASAAPRSQP